MNHTVSVTCPIIRNIRWHTTRGISTTARRIFDISRIVLQLRRGVQFVFCGHSTGRPTCRNNVVTASQLASIVEKQDLGGATVLVR
jgi:hypothetical protein